MTSLDALFGEATTDWPDALPGHLSASQITMYQRCREQYRRRYMLGEKERPGAALSTAEIHERAGSSRLNSRIAELRKRGYNIAYEFVGGVGPEAHAYRLICTEETTSGGLDSVGSPPPGDAPSSVQMFFGAAA